MLGVLTLLWLADGLFLCELALGNVELAARAINGGINLALLLVTIIGGRIVPSFTANALRSRGQDVKMRSSIWIERGVIAAMIGVLLVDAVLPMSAAAAILAALAAVAHAIRMGGWSTWLTRPQPIVWVLHIGYAWLPVGFAMKTLNLLLGFDWTALWLHGLTMGALATMIVAVITRAALGHTGKERSSWNTE